MLREFSHIEGRTRKDAQADGWPQFHLEVLLDPGNLAAFKTLLGNVVRRVRGDTAPRAIV